MYYFSLVLPSSRLHCVPKAIYSVRVPFKHNVSTDHLHNRGHPASATATSRSYDFELEHRRTQSADHTLSGETYPLLPSFLLPSFLPSSQLRDSVFGCKKKLLSS